MEEGGEARTDVGATSAFQLDVSQRWTTKKLPTAVTDGQPWVCRYSSPRLFSEEFTPPPYISLSPSSSSVWHLPAVPSSLVASMQGGFSVKLKCMQTLPESSSVALQNQWLKQVAFGRNPGKLMTTVPCPGEMQGWGGGRRRAEGSSWMNFQLPGCCD